ncbi:single-stranded-DNA-specific exonuclease RecJ [Candidatus Saccharibacteria bacterium]|nr:single-stranded-DNA-specific exonuclease RecJ [Candidatus Saccharibacteria bacterium]
MNKLFVRLLKSRGLTPDFLNPKYEQTTDPFTLPGIEAAVARIKQAIQNHEKILIYGDYDVDGVTASTLMEQTLLLAGVNPKNIDIMLPDRFADGYGMSPKLIEKAKDQKTTLVITVDCGSGNHAIVDELNTLNIDTIITDHHETPEKLPDAIAIINPKRKDHPTSELKNLAGVGVAFKLAQALVKQNLIKEGQEKWLLDLVLLGTICDNMTLTNENRILCYYGLKVLEKTRRPGLRELMSKARVKNLTSDSIGFQIGPRLNAAGRLESANISLELLRTKSPTEAATLAAKLEDLNQRRRTEQQAATKEIKTRGIKEDPVIIETGHWHEGIIGIVAGRLVEDYHKPAFVLTEVEPGHFKGSGRSFGDFSLADALDYVRDTIVGGGGHAGAAGVRVEQEHLYAFREKLNAYYKSLHLKNQEQFLAPHADLALEDFSDLTLDFLADLKQLEPFGAGNEEPIFKLKNAQITGVTRMGADRNHLKLDLRDKNGKYLKLVAFYAPENWLNLDPDDPMLKIEPLIKLTENDFNGVKSVEARIIDLIFLND